MSPRPVRLVALVLAFALAGCGTRSYLVADTAKYPISLSSGVRDEQGDLVPRESLQKVGSFEYDYTTCSMLWTIVPLWGGKVDLSDAVNREVAADHGEAIINLRVEASTFVLSILTFFGVLPDCNPVRVFGDVVARPRGPRPDVATTPSSAPSPTVVTSAPALPPAAPAPAH